MLVGMPFHIKLLYKVDDVYLDMLVDSELDFLGSQREVSPFSTSNITASKSFVFSKSASNMLKVFLTQSEYSQARESESTSRRVGHSAAYTVLPAAVKLSA